MAKFDTAGLRLEWDTSESLRERMRAGLPLLNGTMNEYSVSRCCLNLDILTPLLVRSFSCSHKRPEVDGLREEVTNFLSMNHRSDSTEDEVDDAAWELRKIVTFIKRKAQRKEVSTALFLHLYN